MTCRDPNREDLMNWLKPELDIYGEEATEFDIEEAIYWFAANWHGGQSSNLYSVLSTSEFHPGPLANGPEPGGLGECLYELLESHME